MPPGNIKLCQEKTENIFVPTQWAHHGPTTLKQCCIDVTDVSTSFDHDMPAGKLIPLTNLFCSREY